MQQHVQSAHKWSRLMQTGAILVMAGLAQALSLAWPFEGALKGEAQGWLQSVSLAVLAYGVDRSQSGKQAFAKAWVFAFAWLAGSIWWLFISMHRYGDLPAPIAGLAVGLMAAGLALFYVSERPVSRHALTPWATLNRHGSAVVW